MGKKIRRALKTKLHHKVALSFLSFLLVLFSIEIGFRMFGVILFRSSVAPKPSEREIHSTTRVLCVGDSFTHGGFVKRDETYPYYLQSLFDQTNSRGPIDPAATIGGHTDKRVVVYNKGVCEMTTNELLKYLPSWLMDYKPDVVILMIGSANLFGSFDYNYLHKRGLRVWLQEKLMDIRIVKFAYILYLQATLSGNIADGINPFMDVFRDGPFYEPVLTDSRWNRYKTFLTEICGPTAAGDKVVSCVSPHGYKLPPSTDSAKLTVHVTSSPLPVDHRHLFVTLHEKFVEDDIDAFEQILTIATTQDVHSQLLDDARAYYYRRFADRARRSVRFDDATRYYFMAIPYEPREYYNYFHLTRAFALQSVVSKEQVFELLDLLKADEPSLAEETGFSWYYNYFEEGRDKEQVIYEWTVAQLEEAVEFILESDSLVVMATYPVSYVVANEAIRVVARSHSLPLVDNLARFEHVEPKEDYFFDDDHCTAAGHKVLADNVYRTLIQIPAVHNSAKSAF